MNELQKLLPVILYRVFSLILLSFALFLVFPHLLFYPGIFFNLLRFCLRPNNLACLLYFLLSFDSQHIIF